MNKSIITIVAILLINLGYGHLARSEINNSPKLNVIIISLNSLRADHLGAYGYRRNTSPNIDKLAKNGVLFEHAQAQSNWTLPNLVSLFTSKYVHSHGIYKRDQKVSEKELTFPEILKLYGYKTAAFVGGLDVVSDYGLNQGFDYYSDKTNGNPTVSFKETMPKILNWLKINKDSKFFLFIQSYDIHYPYNHPEPYDHMYDRHYSGILSELPIDYSFLKTIHNDTGVLKDKQARLGIKDIEHIIAHYDGGITYTDKFIGELLGEIEKLKLSDNTIIIITSEHGDELYDHGSFDRFGQNNLYEEVVHIPLIIRNPALNLKGKRITSLVQLVDIMPTLLDFLGIPINKEAQGLSLFPLIEGKNIKDNFNKYVYAEADCNKRSIRTKEWKLIYSSNKYELYNLYRDLKEEHSIVDQKPEVVYELMQKLSDWYEKTRTTSTPDDSHLELTEEMKNKLREAGYW